MIKITRTSKPVQLTKALQESLTEEFKKTGKNVWNIPFLKDALLAMSGNKCCYCEADISEESKYLEVEHFHNKDKYQNEVLEWDNLLPSCKRCNGTKSSHDTIIEPIINPCNINPKDHLLFWNYRIKAVDSLGRMTISVLNLNDQDRLVTKRFEIGNAIHDRLEHLNDLMDDYISGIQSNTLRRNRIISGLKKLLKEGLPNVIYAATSSTIIINDIEYSNLKRKLNDSGLWDSELSEIENKLSTVSLNLAK
jgi:hypothetical protein